MELPAMRVHVLTPGFKNPNSSAFLFPFLAFSKALQSSGIGVSFHSEISDALIDCDVIMIDHKSITVDWDESRSLEKVANLSEKTRVIWCDQADSSGTFLGQVLPYVEKYLKAQLLTDTDMYKQIYHGDRVYTDFYHKNYDVTDDRYYYYAPVKNEDDLAKLGISWNSGMMNHGFYGPWLNRFLDIMPASLLARYAKMEGSAKKARPAGLSCRMGISYPRPTVRYQREQIRTLVQDKMPVDKLSRRAYFEEMCSCALCLSAFGYGEITLKDFEAFLTGAMLLKPDMSHMSTWPDFFIKDETYVAFDWDLNNLRQVIDHWLSHPEKSKEIAAGGQDQYLRFTSGNEAPKLFLEHFKKMLEPQFDKQK